MKPKPRLPGSTFAVSNTGPLISAFQSNSFGLLTDIFTEIHTSTICIDELEQHGWKNEIQAVAPKLVGVGLTPDEEHHALFLARQIARHSNTHDPIAESHLGESQAIVLALRPEYQHDLLLLDELAAREVARGVNVNLSGFPGVLLLAVQGGLLSAEDLKTRLETCREQGTHYGAAFIRQVYEMASQGRRPQ